MFKCLLGFYTINFYQLVLFQMESEAGGSSDGGDEETELNILPEFDFDPNQDATWLLTSPMHSPGAGLM